MNHPFLISLKRMIRQDDCSSSPSVFIFVDHKYFKPIFCVDCGNYFEKKNKNIGCFCDERNTLFKLYQNFFDTFCETYDGDVFDDYLEFTDEVHPEILRYIYKAVLFGITFKQVNYNNIGDYVFENILSYL